MDTTNSFYPMDFGATSMQTDGMSGLSSPPVSNVQSSNANAFSDGGGAFMGSNSQSPPKPPSAGEGYTMGFMIPKANQ